jgi:hypothetical protein
VGESPLVAPTVKKPLKSILPIAIALPENRYSNAATPVTVYFFITFIGHSSYLLNDGQNQQSGWRSTAPEIILMKMC